MRGDQWSAKVAKAAVRLTFMGDVSCESEEGERWNAHKGSAMGIVFKRLDDGEAEFGCGVGGIYGVTMALGGAVAIAVVFGIGGKGVGGGDFAGGGCGHFDDAFEFFGQDVVDVAGIVGGCAVTECESDSFVGAFVVDVHFAAEAVGGRHGLELTDSFDLREVDDRGRFLFVAADGGEQQGGGEDDEGGGVGVLHGGRIEDGGARGVGGWRQPSDSPSRRLVTMMRSWVAPSGESKR